MKRKDDPARFVTRTVTPKEAERIINEGVDHIDKEIDGLKIRRDGLLGLKHTISQRDSQTR
jgi:hypothetical protein